MCYLCVVCGIVCVCMYVHGCVCIDVCVCVLVVHTVKVPTPAELSAGQSLCRVVAMKQQCHSIGSKNGALRTMPVVVLKIVQLMATCIVKILIR